MHQQCIGECLFMYVCILIPYSIQLEEAENYDERSKIRAAIREVRKASGIQTRRATGKSSYVRPGTGLNTPSITIPNSVTGNVLPSKLVAGTSVKAPDKSTPTIGYLNSQTTQSKKTGHTSTESSHTFGSQVPSKEESWWKHSRDSTSTAGDTPEPHVSIIAHLHIYIIMLHVGSSGHQVQ